MDEALNLHERQDQRKGRIISALLHAIVFIILILPLLTYPEPPPGQQGVLVSFGEPDMGKGNDSPDTQQEEVVKPQPASQPAVVEPEQKPIEKPVESKPKPQEAPKLQTQQDPEQIAIQQRKREAERERQIQEEREKQIAEQQRQEELERQRAEEEARKKAEAEKREYEEAKKQYGDLFGGGKGNTETAGNEGDPDGDPNSDVLTGISTGAGTIGGGLENRGGAGPKIEDQSQEQGKVVIKICIDSSGRVVSANYTQGGSTTTNRTLINLAIANAKKYRFDSSSLDRQCGTIAYNFKVQ